jgi:hypothetical protein
MIRRTSTRPAADAGGITKVAVALPYVTFSSLGAICRLVILRLVEPKATIRSEASAVLCRLLICLWASVCMCVCVCVYRTKSHDKIGGVRCVVYVVDPFVGECVCVCVCVCKCVRASCVALNGACTHVYMCVFVAK